MLQSQISDFAVTVVAFTQHPVLMIVVVAIIPHCVGVQVAMLKGEEGIQVITSLSHDASTGLVTLPTHLSLQTLQGQGIPSFTIGGEQGQQVLVVTDPSQLEMLQVRGGWCLTSLSWGWSGRLVSWRCYR